MLNFEGVYMYTMRFQMPLNEWSWTEKTMIFVGIYNQQFQGTIILMVFDFQCIYIIYIYALEMKDHLEHNLLWN